MARDKLHGNGADDDCYKYMAEMAEKPRIRDFTMEGSFGGFLVVVVVVFSLFLKSAFSLLPFFVLFPQKKPAFIGIISKLECLLNKGNRIGL